jgi:hypothetical protein
MHLYLITAAASQKSNGDTPWAYRDARYSGVIVGVLPDPNNADKITGRGKDYWEALLPFSSGGAF